MSARLNETWAVKAINTHLHEHGFRPRDSDGSDFAFGDDSSLRFKTGTVYGEVTITIWRNNKSTQTLRVFSDSHVVEVKHQIDDIINGWRGIERHEITDGDGNVLADVYVPENEISDRWSPR